MMVKNLLVLSLKVFTRYILDEKHITNFTVVRCVISI